jgi:hypothetical protein
MANVFEVAEGIQKQSPDEELAYSVDVADIGTPASVTQVKAYDESVDEDVTETVYPTNSPSITDTTIILLSLLKDLTLNHSYRIEILWVDDGGNSWEGQIPVRCTKK